MNTFIFLWSPKDWPWKPSKDDPEQKTLAEAIHEVEESGITLEKWVCRHHRMIRPGDKAYLAVTGKNNNGIIGSGVICDIPPFLAEDSRIGVNKKVYKVWIQFDVLLDPSKDDLLTRSTIVKEIPKYNPRSSGAVIAAEVAYKIDKLWGNVTRKDSIAELVEGAPKQITQTVYERNIKARQQCIDHYGLSCFVCTFNFEKFYGDIGKDFIHVHHLTQFPLFGVEHTVDPVKALIPVCPNCHSMIHRRKKAYSPEEIKEYIDNRKIFL